MSEIWKKCEIAPNYEISSFGNVRRAFLNGERINRLLKPYIHSNGYGEVHLSKVGKQSIHRLVLQTFIGPAPINTEANHKNGIKMDNRIENLEWITRSENMKHAYRNGLILNLNKKGSKNGRAIVSENDIISIIKMRQEGFVLREISNKFGICISAVNNIIKGKSWRHVNGQN